MKYAMTTIAILALWQPVGTVAETASAPESDNDTAVYSLGYELGKELKGHTLELDADLLIQGVKDGIEGNKPLVKTTSRQKALAQIREQRAKDNLAQSQAFLAENAKKDGVITLDSGLQYKVIQSGEGRSPQARDSVTVNYRASLIDGTDLDSSYDKGQPSTYQMNRVIRGWREAMALMKEGDKWELYIPPELGYGKRGLRGRIPPNSALIYEVELIAVSATPEVQKRSPTPPVPGAKPREE
jgi:FKBP-type peptidyl-prolyl cis-trans isomerase FklB